MCEKKNKKMATSTLIKRQIPVTINSMGFAEPPAQVVYNLEKQQLPQRQFEYPAPVQQFQQQKPTTYVSIPQPVYQQQQQPIQIYQPQQQQQQIQIQQQKPSVALKKKGGMTAETKMLKDKYFTKDDRKKLKTQVKYTKKGTPTKLRVDDVLAEKGFVKKPKQLAKSLVMVLSFNKFIHELLLLQNENSPERDTKKIKWVNSMKIGNMLRKNYLDGKLEDTVYNRRIVYAYNTILKMTQDFGRHITNQEARQVVTDTLQKRV